MKLLVHNFLCSEISDDKPVNHPIKYSLNMTNHFFLIFHFFKLIINYLSWCLLGWSYWSPLSFLRACSTLLCKVQSSSHLFSFSSFFSIWDSHSSHVMASNASVHLQICLFLTVHTRFCTFFWLRITKLALNSSKFSFHLCASLGYVSFLVFWVSIFSVFG